MVISCGYMDKISYTQLIETGPDQYQALFLSYWFIIVMMSGILGFVYTQLIVTGLQSSQKLQKIS